MVIKLNTDHPNHWRPPNDYDEEFLGYYPLNIYKGRPTTVNRSYNAFEDDPFLQTTRRLTTKAFAWGSIVGLTDACLINTHLTTTRAILTRYAYVTSPYVAMSISYCAAREFLGGLSKEKNAMWTYGAAALAPGCVWGLFHNCPVRGFKTTVVLGIVGMAYKYNCDKGHHFTGGHHDFKVEARYGSNEGARLANLNPLAWKRSDWTVGQSEEAGWKKHVENPEKGPSM